MTDKIYISYRRDGSEALTYLINEKLTAEGFNTCCNMNSPREGSFNEGILSIIKDSDDFIVVLSPTGLEACMDENDWVRKELIFALKENKNIVPVIWGELSIPDEFPEELKGLRELKGIPVNMAHFDTAFNTLTSMLSTRKASKYSGLLNSITDEELRRELKECAKELSLTNSADAKYNMAKALQKVKSSSLNEEIARLFYEASKMGHSSAQSDLGVLYERGIGVEKNILKAFDYYKMSADQGNPVGQHNLACTISSYSKTLHFNLMKMAAEQNDVTALVNLASCYADGYGVRRNNKKSREYYEKAVALGRDDLKKKTTDNYWRRKRVADVFYDFLAD